MEVAKRGTSYRSLPPNQYRQTVLFASNSYVLVDVFEPLVTDKHTILRVQNNAIGMVPCTVFRSQLRAFPSYGHCLNLHCPNK